MPRRVASGSIRPAKASAPNVCDGKECVASTHPQIWPRNRKVPGPYFCTPSIQRVKGASILEIKKWAALLRGND
jgi:hypothetical protein